MNKQILREVLRRHQAKNRGMSLVEIIIVIVLVTTVMAVVAGGVMNAFGEAQVEETKLRIGKVEQGLQMYAAKHKGKYPSTSDGLGSVSKYLDGGEATDAWGFELLYFSPAQNCDDPYEIKSLGKDGAEGGEADSTEADVSSCGIGE